MTYSDTQSGTFDLIQAREDGRRQGLAIAALMMSVIAFLNLLGFEKSFMAIVLAGLAMSGSGSAIVRRRSSVAIGLALIHLATIGAVLLLFRAQLGQLMQLLYKLG